MKNKKSTHPKIQSTKIRTKSLLNVIGFRIHFILFLLLSYASILNAQSSYRFEVTNDTYTDLSGDTIIPRSAFDPNLNTYFILSPLTGETFNFYEIPFTFGGIKTFAVQPNASLRIDNDSSLIIIDVAFAGMDSIDPTSSRSYAISGSPGNYVFKAQWKNLMINVGPANNYVNVQIWVYQQSGIVELRYGPSSANNASGYNTTYGPQVGMFYSRDDFTQCYEKLWVTGSPSNIILDSAANYSFLAMSGVPSNGTVYRFIPKSAPTSTENLSPELNNILIYPNPSSDELNIKTNSQEIYKLEIYTTLGQRILTKNISLNTSISMDHLPSGIYYAKVISKTGSSTIQKVELTR